MSFFCLGRNQKRNICSTGLNPTTCTTKGSTTVPCTLGILPPMKQHHPFFHIKQQGQHLANPVLFEGAMNRSSDGFSFFALGRITPGHLTSMELRTALHTKMFKMWVGQKYRSQVLLASCRFNLLKPCKVGKNCQHQPVWKSFCWTKNWFSGRTDGFVSNFQGFLKWNCLQLSSAWGLKWFPGKRIKSSKRRLCTDWTMNVGEGFVWSLEYAVALRKSCHSHVFATGGFVCPFEGVIYSLRVEFTRIRKPSRLVFPEKVWHFCRVEIMEAYWALAIYEKNVLSCAKKHPKHEWIMLWLSMSIADLWFWKSWENVQTLQVTGG